MYAADLHTSHAVNFRYYEQNVNFSRTAAPKGGGATELFSLSSRRVEFSLEVKSFGGQQNQTQAAVAAGLAERLAEYGIDLGKFSHEGRSLLDLTPAEAQALVAEDGYWGVQKTSLRLAEFVLKGAGDNLELLRAGREGILRGFKEAEKIWGGELPEISHQTIEKALELIDERIRELGGSVVDRSV